MDKTFEVLSEDSGERLDKWLSGKLEDKSRASVKTLISTAHVLVNGQQTKAGHILKTGDTVTFSEPEEKTVDLTPKTVEFETVHEDAYLMIIHKPSGLVVHPSKTYTEPTLMHGILDRIDDATTFEHPERAGIVHRLDKDTSGLLVVAKTPDTLKKLQEALKERRIKRSYHAIVEGVIHHNKGTVDAPIGRHRTRRKLMSVKEGGRESVTHFTVLERFERHTYIRCELETGRTHQIRVHMRYIDHPVTGDKDYGRRKAHTDDFGQYLHAHTLEFTHPETGEAMRFTAEPPEPFATKLNDLRASRT